MNVRVLINQQKDHMSLIEYTDEEGMLCRGSVMSELIVDNAIDDNLTSLIIPYGLDWEYIINSGSLELNAKDISKALYKRGIYTKEDIIKNRDKAITALQEAYGITLSKLISLANNYGGK